MSNVSAAEASTAAALGHVLERSADHRGCVTPPGEEERRQKGMGRTAGPARHPPHEHLAAAIGLAHVAPVAPPERRRCGAIRAVGPRDLDICAGRGIRVDRQRAGKYDGHRQQHRLGPPPERATKQDREGVPRVQGDRSSSQVVGPRVQKLRCQTAPPRTARGSSDSHAVNTGRAPRSARSVAKHPVPHDRPLRPANGASAANRSPGVRDPSPNQRWKEFQMRQSREWR